MSNFFERLLEERKRLGLNQDEMAKAGGVSKRTYCNYESGERSPDANFLMALFAAGADVQYILTGRRMGIAQGQGQGQGIFSEPAGYQAEESLALTRRERALLKNVRECAEEDVRAIERFAMRGSEAQHQDKKRA